MKKKFVNCFISDRSICKKIVFFLILLLCLQPSFASSPNWDQYIYNIDLQCFQQKCIETNFTNSVGECLFQPDKGGDLNRSEYLFLRNRAYENFNNQSEALGLIFRSCVNPRPMDPPYQPIHKRIWYGFWYNLTSLFVTIVDFIVSN